MGKSQKNTEILSTGETIREFNARLYREHRTEEFRERCAALREAEGISFLKARRRLAGEFGPVDGGGAPAARVKPSGDGAGAPVEPVVAVEQGPAGPPTSFEDTASYAESLQWVGTALGLADQGHAINAKDAPGPTAWGLFCWALKQRKEFYALWATEGRKRSEEEDGGVARDSIRQAEEVEQMILEVKAQAEEAVKKPQKLQKGRRKK